MSQTKKIVKSKFSAKSKKSTNKDDTAIKKGKKLALDEG